MEIPFLVTERARLRRIVREDYDEMMAVYGDLELMRFVGDSTAISAEDCARWVDVTLNNYSTQGYGLFLVESLEGFCIGFIGLTHPGGRVDPEIKYVLKREYWGQGIAQEIVRALCSHGCEAWRLGRIVATVDPATEASNRVLEKCGFRREPDILDEDGLATAFWVIEKPRTL